MDKNYTFNFIDDYCKLLKYLYLGNKVQYSDNGYNLELSMDKNLRIRAINLDSKNNEEFMLNLSLSKSIYVVGMLKSNGTWDIVEETINS